MLELDQAQQWMNKELLFHESRTVADRGASNPNSRHYSSIIGRVIEKQLTELQIFDKVTTITCDGAPKIVGLFDYFSRTGIWLKKVTVIQESDTNMIDIDEHLSQTVRTIKINEDIEDEQEEGDDDDEEQEDIEECNQDGSELESATTDSSTSDQQSDEDESEDDEDEESDLEDNFQYGVNTDDDDNNTLPIEIDQGV
ncbi:unnamed protein product, partial [Rotaria sordida]